MVGVVVSCTLVAYGFARFRFPGRSLLFMILIATIFLPGAVTVIPTYTVFSKIGWVGTWLPLLVPVFFANAFDVFLLRQYLMTIPREMDEAAAIDGAGPFRTLVSVILPQAWPVIIAVAIFHFVYSWNDFFNPLIYLSTKPELQTLAVGLAAVQRHPLPEPGLRPGGDADDDGDPGHHLPHLPEGLRPRRGDHRGGEVSAADRDRFRVALTIDAEFPDRPHGAGRHGRDSSTCWRRRGVRATVFIQGRWAEAEPALARRIAADGHLVANDSHHHAPDARC